MTVKLLMVLGDDEPEETKYLYRLGEIITVNSVDKYKCVKKTPKDGCLYQYFKKGKISYDW